MKRNDQSNPEEFYTLSFLEAKTGTMDDFKVDVKKRATALKRRHNCNIENITFLDKSKDDKILLLAMVVYDKNIQDYLKNPNLWKSEK